MLGPNSARNMTATKNTGKASTMSVIRMSIASGHAPKYPATAPTRTPSVTAIAADRKPMVSDVRDAQMVRLSTSRPRWSVPNAWAAPGGTSRWSKFATSGVYGATVEAATAIAARRTSTSAPRRARGLRENRWATPRRRGGERETAIGQRAQS